MNKVLTIYTDGDTKVHHPKTKELLDSNNTYEYKFNIHKDNKGKFIIALSNNDFMFGDHFYDILLNKFDEIVEMIEQLDGRVEFYNWYISITDKPIIYDI